VVTLLLKLPPVLLKTARRPLGLGSVGILIQVSLVTVNFAEDILVQVSLDVLHAVLRWEDEASGLSMWS
jgi:hypothetical protein